MWSRCRAAVATPPTPSSQGAANVLISYENEAILARQSGEDFDYIVPAATLKIENPGAVLKDANPKARTYLDFVLSTAGQEEFVKKGFRPVVADTPVGEVEPAPTIRPTRSRCRASCSPSRSGWLGSGERQVLRREDGHRAGDAEGDGQVAVTPRPGPRDRAPASSGRRSWRGHQHRWPRDRHRRADAQSATSLTPVAGLGLGCDADLVQPARAHPLIAMLVQASAGGLVGVLGGADQPADRGRTAS